MLWLWWWRYMRGETSVLLHYVYKGSIPEDNPTVMWTRSDLNPKSVHLQGKGGDDLKGQNQRYSGRTSMSRYALNTKDFSLTLRKPKLTDSGIYTCSISAGGEEQRLSDIQLQVKDHQVEVKVEEGSESVTLPCKTTPDLPENTRVEWTRSDHELLIVQEYSNKDCQVEVESGVESVKMPFKTKAKNIPEDAKVEWKNRYNNKVHVHQNGCDRIEDQSPAYRKRTEMNLLETGDLSLTLKHPTNKDRGTYTCTVYNKEGGKFQIDKQVELKVRGGGGFRGGVCPAAFQNQSSSDLKKDPKVEWTENKKVHVYKNGSDQPEEQHQYYRDRTEMNEDLLKTGDLSLTLKYPTDWDTNTYTCTVYSSSCMLKKKQEVKLEVRVCQVEEGAESVQLPFKTTENLPEDVRVKWRDRYNRKLHVYQNGWRPEEQHQVYRDRTKMNEDLLKTGDLSLSLKQPTGEFRSRIKQGTSGTEAAPWIRLL
ncbi:butyrophilin [Sarotherodon galilaeus]